MRASDDYVDFWALTVVDSKALLRKGIGVLYGGHIMALLRRSFGLPEMLTAARVSVVSVIVS